MKQKLIDLGAQRAQCIQDAEAALNAGKTADYDAAMEKVTNLNAEIGRVRTLLEEQERRIDAQLPGAREARDMAAERGDQLMRGELVRFSAREVRRALNSVTVATGTLVAPTGAGTDIRDPADRSVVGSIIDQVYVQDLTGMPSFLEPYAIDEYEASDGDPATLAGTARPTSDDPTFAVAELRPWEVNVTTFVDRNIARLTPADYYAKIYSMAMRALRRKVTSLIINGDGGVSPTFMGITCAKNKAGAEIFAKADLDVIGVNTLDDLYFAYGSSETLGPSARLLLTKANLKAIGALRGTNEKRRLFAISPDAGNANTGVISDGGVVIPYTLTSDVGDDTLLYGDPINYELGLFGDYSIRVDESVKAVERMVAILGDAFVGGNLVRHHGFAVGKIGGE